MNLIPITPDQQQTLAEAGDSPVELADPRTGTASVLPRADDYRRLRDQAEDRRDLDDWAKLAKKARDARDAEDSG